MREYHILNLGAGVQSTTLYLMFMQGVLRPKLDCAIFADTGDEPKAVYEHLRWMLSLLGAPILVRSRSRLGDDLMRGENATRQRFVSIPAFTKDPTSADEGRTRRQCSREYKIEVIDRTIRRDVLGLAPRRKIPKSVVIHRYVGISLDECGRFERLKRRRLGGGGIFHAPLIEKFMTRRDCVEWLQEYGNVPHEVPRSACVFCPFHSDEEWLRIKSVPEDWQRAVEIDEALRRPGVIVNRNMNSDMYVHRSCQPLVQIEFTPKVASGQQSIPFWRECLGVCGV